MMTPTPLDAAELRARLVDDGPYAALDVVTVTGSTNTDLAAAASAGAADRTVLLAEEQQAGRGRMQRSWVSPRGYGLHVSVVLRPLVAQAAIAWLPLLAGIALAETVRGMAGLRAHLKWPNDLLLGSPDEARKGAGILAEGVTNLDGMAVVLGTGVNVHHRLDDLPARPGGLAATSLAAEGAEVDRTEFAIRLLGSFARIDQQWRDSGGEVVETGLLARYRNLCATVGQRVRVELGGDDELHGTAEGIDPGGRLLIRDDADAVTPISAGDVVHVRPVPR